MCMGPSTNLAYRVSYMVTACRFRVAEQQINHGLRLQAKSDTLELGTEAEGMKTFVLYMMPEAATTIQVQAMREGGHPELQISSTKLGIWLLAV